MNIHGLILKGIGGFYYVKTTEGLLECRAKGTFRKKEQSPLPGDRVTVEFLADEPGKGRILSIEDRKTLLIRPAVANIDCLIIVLSCINPKPDFLLADKLLVSCRLRGIEPILLFNKMDLVNRSETETMTGQYFGAVKHIIINDIHTGRGVKKIQNIIGGKLTAVAGQSGVGKSTIINMMVGRQAMETGVISSKNLRGRHTTRHAELLPVGNNGYILDTPGFSRYDLDVLNHEDIWRYYPEMSGCGEDCRFNKCIHVNEPECKIKEKVKKGDISQERYQRYTALLAESKQAEKNRIRR